MIYIAIKPIQEGFCKGCVFSSYNKHCENPDMDKYPCCDEHSDHIHIYGILTKINNNIKIL